MKRGLLTSLLVAVFIPGVVISQSKNIAEFKNWPRGTSPREIGIRVADHFVATPHTNFNRPTPPRSITYTETCTWYGTMTFAKETGNKKLLQQMVDRFQPMFGSQ